MQSKVLVRAIALLLCLTLASPPKPAKADSLDFTKDIVLISIGIAVIGAGIGIGIYYSIKHSHTLRGCAVAGPDGLELRNEGDQQTFKLLGITADVKAGDRVKVVGKKKKNGKNDTSNRTFLVEKLGRDYGPCKVMPATP
jgi:hypothetical protein